MNISNPFKLLADAVQSSNIATEAVTYGKLNIDVTNHFNIDFIEVSGPYSPAYSGLFLLITIGAGAGGNGGYSLGATSTLVSNAGRPGRSGEVRIEKVVLYPTQIYNMIVGVGGAGGQGETSTATATVGQNGTDTSFGTFTAAKGGQYTNMIDDKPSLNQLLAYSAENQGFNTATGLKVFLTNGEGETGVTGIFPGGGGSGGGGNSNSATPAFIGGAGGAGANGLIILVSI